MASSSLLSKSILTEQTALNCQLCEDEPKIKWKCLECKILMCQRCKKKVHPKFPTADDHNIVDIKDLGKHEEEKKPDFTKLTCAQHEGQNCCLFCKTCVELVCPLCIANKHKKHDLVELQEGYQIQVENIRNGQSKIIEGITIQATYKDRLKQIQYLHQLSYDRTKQDILDKENALHIAVKKQTNKLLHELDRKWKDTSQSLDSADKQVDENQKTFLEQNDKVNNMIQSDDVKDIFNISDVLWKSMETNIKPVNTTFNSSKFVPGKIVEISILFGTLDNVSIQQNTDLKVRTSYSTELKHITKIISSHDDLHYILGTSLKNLQKVKLTRDTIKVKSDLVLERIDMALTSSGDLIILNKDSSKIKIIPSGTLEVKDSVYNISPLLPLGVHVTHDNKVIVGAGDTESRLVIVMDQAGRKEKAFKNNKDQPLLTCPSRITSNRRNYIGVIDWISQDLKGRVVVLDQEGRLSNIYNGHPNFNKEDNPFSPIDIVSTRSDNFVVSEPFYNRIHILNSNGDFIIYYNTEELGVKYPFCLSFSHLGVLYIGCFCDDDSEDKAKIYKMDNFLW